MELAGPAGAGKTTLARALVADSPATTTGVQVGPLSLAVGLVSAAPQLAAARLSAPGRSWTRDELRSLAYLRAWRRAVGDGEGLLVLDHGPVFRLASLAAFGPPMAASRAFAGCGPGWPRTGAPCSTQWSGSTPPTTCCCAGSTGAQAAPDPARGPDEGAKFLARYREAYRTTLALVAAPAPGRGGRHRSHVARRAGRRARATLHVPSTRLST